MGINEDGIQAERLGRLFLMDMGIHNLQQIDWLFKFNGKYYAAEIKSRELFNPPPFLGTGLDITQLNLRKQIFDDLCIDTYLIVFEKDTERTYWQRLSVLESGEYFDTRNGIRIYPITNFKCNDERGEN